MNPFALCQIADNNYGWPILGKILLQPAEVLSMVRQGVKRWNCAFFQPIKSWIPMYLVSGNSMGRVPSMRLRKRLGFRIFFDFQFFQCPGFEKKKDQTVGSKPTNQGAPKRCVPARLQEIGPPARLHQRLPLSRLLQQVVEYRWRLPRVAERVVSLLKNWMEWPSMNLVLEVCDRAELFSTLSD